MGPDELDNDQIRSYITIDDERIELPDMGTEYNNEAISAIANNSEQLYTNAMRMTEASETITSYIRATLEREQIDILNEIKKMPVDEKREMLMALLDAFDDNIKDKTEVTEKLLKINRLKQILGHPKNSAS